MEVNILFVQLIYFKESLTLRKIIIIKKRIIIILCKCVVCICYPVCALQHVESSRASVILSLLKYQDHALDPGWPTHWLQREIIEWVYTHINHMKYLATFSIKTWDITTAGSYESVWMIKCWMMQEEEYLSTYAGTYWHYCSHQCFWSMLSLQLRVLPTRCMALLVCAIHVCMSWVWENVSLCV